MIIGIVLIALIAPAVSAANMTRIFPPTDTLIVNQTQIYSTAWTTPLVFFLLMIIVGLLMLVASIIMPPETPYDMIGWLAPVPLIFSDIMLFIGIDVKTSAGITAINSEGINTLMMIENHTIYRPWLLTIFIFVLFIISIVNISRIQKAKADKLIKQPED